MRRGDKLCKEWADGIRKSLMVNRTTEVTKTIDVIRSESGTRESQTSLSRPRFWTLGRKDMPFMDTILRAGLEVDFEPNGDGIVEQVTFRLNETWLGVQQRFARLNAP